MSHVVRTPDSHSPGEPPPWKVLLDDGSPAGPADLDTLRKWAAEGTLTATCRISKDGEAWTQASLLPELEMDWLVLISQEAVMGPFAFAALEVLRASGHIPQEAQVFKRQAAPAAGSQGMQLVQRAVSAEAHRREAEGEVQRLKANVKAKELEFDAERQQLAAESSRLRADLLRRDAEISSLKGNLEQLGAGMEDRQALEAKVVDLEREAARLRGESEDAQRLAETLRQERDADRQALEASRASREQFAETLRQLDALRAFVAQRNERIEALGRELRDLADGMPEAPDGQASAAPPAPPTPPPSGKLPPTTPPQGQHGTRRIAPQPVAKAPQSTSEVVVEVLPPDAVATVQTPPPMRTATAVNTKKLAELEAQAQQELARLKQAKSETPFWNRRKAPV